MSDLDQKLKEQLLQKREVVEEIQRHLWIESEKNGRDVGFETAAEDWLKRYASAWVAYHMPQQKIKPPEPAKSKKRSAKSYFKAS